MNPKMLERLGLTEADFKPKEKNEDARITALEEQNEMLIECILEMADIIYNE